MNTVSNKKKIFNDPLYGFITIESELLFEIIEHPYFQRLRRIKQLGLTDLVYPGAHHTRFHHALGAMHLMSVALNGLKIKDVEISNEEYNASLIAILLHDIGHGPFSHVLEHTLLDGVHHESISLILMQELNETFCGQLSLAIEIFTDKYKRKFFHQLVSSQLDIDRLDYLNRDSFFTGVSEGIVGVDRILKMLEVVDDEIVVEEKGIYSIENFLNARRIMYWQVYLHKTTLSTEIMMSQIIKRAKELSKLGKEFPCTPALSYFLKNEVSLEAFTNDKNIIKLFTSLDDFDIWGAIKVWATGADKTLSLLCNGLLYRKLLKVEIHTQAISKEKIQSIKNEVKVNFNLSNTEVNYFVRTGFVSNAAYFSEIEKIKIKLKTGEITDIADATDLPNIKAIRKIVRKYYVCYPKTLYL